MEGRSPGDDGRFKTAEDGPAPPRLSPRRFLTVLAFVALCAGGAALRLISIGQPFWMDESFTSTLATQPPSMIARVCAKDVHPPGYFLLLRGWNAICRAVLQSPPPTREWTLLDFNVQAIETAGKFTAVRDDGLRRESTGVFPEDWAEWPLAPLGALRAMSLLIAIAVGALLWRLGGRLCPANPPIRWIALIVFSLSGFTIVWDGVIRSYNASALAVLALALVCLRGAQDSRWRAAGPAAAALVFAAFMTNYVTLLHLPGIALAAWAWGGFHRKDIIALTLSFLGGAGVVALAWGGEFLKQTGLTPSEPAFAIPLGQSFGDAFGSVSLDYWSLPYSEGFWVWLAHGRAVDMNRLATLDPTRPALYFIGFALYAAAIGVNVWDLIKRPSRPLVVLFLLALLPGWIVLTMNGIKPGSLRAHGRHLYAVAPFFFLFLARGWAAAAGRASAGLHRPSRAGGKAPAPPGRL